jgi:hypothetical protein
MALEETVIKSQSNKNRTYTMPMKEEESPTKIEKVEVKAPPVDSVSQEIYDSLKAKFLEKESEIDTRNVKIQDLE